VAQALSLAIRACGGHLEAEGVPSPFRRRPAAPSGPWGRRTMSANTGGCYRRSRNFRRLAGPLRDWSSRGVTHRSPQTLKMISCSGLTWGFAWWQVLDSNQRSLRAC
jgi:hypothetical protein